MNQKEMVKRLEIDGAIVLLGVYLDEEGITYAYMDIDYQKKEYHLPIRITNLDDAARLKNFFEEGLMGIIQAFLLKEDVQ